MQKRLSSALAASLLAGALAVASTAPAAGQAMPTENQSMSMPKVGDMAPDFTLLANDWKPVKLSDFRGKKNVILAFYVLAFTGG